MNNGSKTFRSALGGYNREDVNAYIKDTDLKHSAELDELRAELDKVKAEIAGYAASVQSAIAERDGARERAHAESVAASALVKAKDEEIAELNKRLHLAKAETDAQNKVIASLRDEKSELSNALEQQKITVAEAKKEGDASIRALRSEYEAKLAECRSETDAAEALREENRSLTETLKQAVTEASALRDESAALNVRIIALEEQLTQSASELAKKNDEIAALTAEHEAAISNCVSRALGDVTDRGSDAYKLDMYDKVSSQLGDILIGANRNADEIVSTAKAEAEKLLTDTQADCEQKRADCDAEVSRIHTEVEEEAAYIRERLSYAATDIIADVSSDLHGSMESCIRELATCVEDMQYEIRTLLSRLTGRSAEMNDRIDYYQSSAADSVSEKLADMDRKYGIRHPSAGKQNLADGETNA